MFLMIRNDGTMLTLDELPDDAPVVVENGHAEFVRFNDAVFERLSIQEGRTPALDHVEWREIL